MHLFDYELGESELGAECAPAKARDCRRGWLNRAAAGVAMIVLPGPAVIVIPIGLAILASEFVWAARLLHRFKLRRNPVPGSAPAAKKATQKSET